MCLVLFTDNAEVKAKAIKSRANPLIIDTDLEAKSMELDYGKNISRKEFWESQFNIDPEKSIHQSYKLYWIWNLKSFFLSDAVHMNSYGSDYYMWIDSGILRDRTYFGRDIMSVIPNMNRGQLYFGLVDAWRETFPQSLGWCDGPSFLFKDRLAGCIFGGYKTTIHRWLRRYKEVITHYVECGMFIGKDQSIMNSLCLRYGMLCHYIDSAINCGRNPWYTPLYYILD